MTSKYSPADKIEQGPYSYVATTQWWKDVCECLPCSIQLSWPGYATAAFHTKIANKSVIIQCWKGWCQHLVPDFGDFYFPGGIGAEVGIYSFSRHEHESIEQVSPEGLPINPLTALRAWWETRKARAGSKDNTRLWWPAPKAVAASQEPVSFTLEHPKFGALISDYSTRTYWTCKWMHESSHEQWCKDHEKKSGEPLLSRDTEPDEYVLRFTVAGIKYLWSKREITVETPSAPEIDMLRLEDIEILRRIDKGEIVEGYAADWWGFTADWWD